jgi:hypothetical protein
MDRDRIEQERGYKCATYFDNNGSSCPTIKFEDIVQPLLPWKQNWLHVNKQNTEPFKKNVNNPRKHGDKSIA